MSSPTTFDPRAERGLSLIEILIALGLMALITGLMVPSFRNAFRISGEAFAKKLALTLGQARDRAMLTDKLIRLRADFDKQQLTLEEAPSQYLVPPVPDRPPSEREREEQEKKEGDSFRLVSELMKEPLKLPNGLRLIEVRSPRYRKPLREGVANVYFFNNGATDGATLYFESEEKTHAAILLHPVTGLSRIEALAPEPQ